jgi:hypothetical protein
MDSPRTPAGRMQGRKAVIEPYQRPIAVVWRTSLEIREYTSGLADVD